MENTPATFIRHKVRKRPNRSTPATIKSAERLHICIAKPNKQCGIETFVNNHVAGLNPTEIISLGYYPVEFENKPGSIFHGPLTNPFVRGVIKNTTPFLFHSLYAHTLSEYLNTHLVDVVLAEYGLVGANVTQGCLKSQTPLVTVFHGFDAFEHQILKKYSGRYRHLFNYANAIIAVSRAMQEQLILLGAPKKRVHWIPYGVDCQKFNPAEETVGPGPVRFIFIGRLIAKKAPDLLISSFKKMNDVWPNTELVMVGEGAMEKECRELIQRMGMQDKIKLAGAALPETVPELLKSADVYVQHSVVSPNGDSEGTPNSILEASAAGLPVVSTFHGGIPDIVRHDDTGFLVEERDIEGMAAFMGRLAGDSSRRREMGRNGRNFICNNFSLPASIERIKKVLREAVEEGARIR
jgi:glycosyltransferase involved in cell wall biosynthesis